MTVYSHSIDMHRPHGICHPASIRLLSCCALFLTLLACSTLPPYRSAPAITGLTQHNTELESFHTPFPPSYEITQRVVVHTATHAFDMTSVLAMREDGSWSAVALGSMGTALFRFHFDKQRYEVITAPASTPRSLLEDGVMRDIQHLFSRRLTDASEVVLHDESLTCLVTRRGAARLDEYCFQRDSRLPARSSRIKDGRVISEVTYHNIGVFPDLPTPVPRTILLRNNKWKYSLDITLLEITALTHQTSSDE